MTYPATSKKCSEKSVLCNEMVCFNRMEDDTKQIILNLIIFESFLKEVPSRIDKFGFARDVIRFAQEQRKLTERLRNTTEVFVFSKCNNILASVGASGKVTGNYDSFVDFSSINNQISHPAFVRMLFYSVEEDEMGEDLHQRPASRNSSLSNIRENQESKYWFFKLHTDLLSIVNCIAKSVAKNSSKQRPAMVNYVSHLVVAFFSFVCRQRM